MARQDQVIAFRHVRIFDGVRILPYDTLVIQGGTITAIGDDTVIPTEAEIINGSGQTLLPGLIDAHTHIFGTALKQALIFGVTTELDMFTDYHMAQLLKQQQNDSSAMAIADLRSAGILATAPGGHGTEYGMTIPTITTPEEAPAFVEARLAEGSDYIKIVYDDGSAFGLNIPTIDKATMTALVQAAHEHGKLAIVHVMTYNQARDALEVGVDGLAHLFIDRPPDAEFGRFVASKQAFVIPTLTVLESASGTPSGASLTSDPNIMPYLSKDDKTYLHRAFPASFANYAVAEEAVRQLKAASVPILAGTDAPNPGTMHGASIHRELELLVQAGLTPLEALASATSVPAAIFGLADRGRIAPALRADLLLVQGDPTADIQATRAIVSIWKRGILLNREGYREELAQQQVATQELVAPVGSEDGLVSDFEDGSISTRFGFGWEVSTDAVRGGKSTAEFKVVHNGPHDSNGSLLVTGEIVTASAFVWAGAMFYPGPVRWAPANLSQKKAIAFWTNHQLLLSPTLYPYC